MTLDAKSEILRFAQFYEEKKTSWQFEEVHQKLVKFVDLLIPPKENSSQVRKIFLPLCGKTKDIPYLLHLGFQVFGIEGVEKAILELSEENSLNLKYNEAESIYFTDDENLVIYHGDFFECPIEKWGPFDAVWDRGSFGTVAYHLRPQYIQVIRRGLKEADTPFRYLLEVHEYAKKLYSVPPLAVTPDEVETYFGSWASMEFLERYPVAPGFYTRQTSLVDQNVTLADYLFKNLRK